MAEPRPILLTNTMGRQQEEFRPRKDGRVTMYTCGPTVYSYAHIGNFRSFITADILRRVLQYNGYRVRQVRNITDVGHLTNEMLGVGEDRLESAARRQGKTPWEIADAYTRAFLVDADKLNLLPPDVSPRATEYIESMIRLAQRLIDDGHAYASGGNVYYAVDSFSSYGKLSGNSVQDLVAGARVEVGEGKRSPADFALWKEAGEDKPMRWESPWGHGVPGWHLECSAMAFDLLGEQIDIHTGGVDNIFPHHEDEIAQSEGASGETFARYWIHSAFLQLGGDEKMSKSSGNIYTVSDLEGMGIHPLAYRYFTFQANYRTPLSFTLEALGAAQTALFRAWEAVAELHQSVDGDTGNSDAVGRDPESYRDRFHGAINSDLDMPGALAVLHDSLGAKLPPAAKLALLTDFDSVLGLQLVAMAERLSQVSAGETAMLQERAAARAGKDWARSDTLRNRLAEGGLEVKDTPAGQRWTRKDVLRDLANTAD